MKDRQIKKKSALLKEVANVWLKREPVIAATLLKNQRRYLEAIHLIKKGEKIAGLNFLDWGCGIPVLTTLLQDEMQCTAYEPFATECQKEFAKTNGFEIQSDLPEGANYDVITMIEVIEHIPVLKDVIPDVVKRLKPGGKLIVTTPNGMRYDQWLTYVRRKRAHPVPLETFLRNTNTYEHHSREFTSYELSQTLEFFGLKVDLIQVKDIQPSYNDRLRYTQILDLAIPSSSRLSKRILTRLWKSLQPSLVCVAHR